MMFNELVHVLQLWNMAVLFTTCSCELSTVVSHGLRLWSMWHALPPQYGCCCPLVLFAAGLPTATLRPLQTSVCRGSNAVGGRDQLPSPFDMAEGSQNQSEPYGDGNDANWHTTTSVSRLEPHWLGLPPFPSRSPLPLPLPLLSLPLLSLPPSLHLSVSPSSPFLTGDSVVKLV